MVEYIDREAAKMHFYDIDADIKQSKAKIGFSLVQVHEALDDIPAADVVPIVHAHWRMEPSRFQVSKDVYAEEIYKICSHCGYIEDFVTNFCPRCGARMDEETPDA